MTSKHRWMGIAAVVALLATMGLACADSENETVDLCENVVCDQDYPGSVCDPLSGKCMCGTGDNRIACQPGDRCETDPSPSCISTACTGRTCTQGMTCDPTDGACKCGTSVCTGDEICIKNECTTPDPCYNKTCPSGETCDPEDGSCKCGGEVCADDQRCEGSVCVQDNCKGVFCGSNSVCNPDDRACHCGSSTGPVCATGEACVLEDGDHICKRTNLCFENNVVCDGENVCDPSTGLCRCGGADESFPVCEEDQRCLDGVCTGGNLCKEECPAGFKCDEDDGVCKCGGEVCTEDQTCMVVVTEGDDEDDFACVEKCNPFIDMCEEGGAGVEAKGCYIDVSIGTSDGYCGPVGETAVGEECKVAHDCAPGTTCHGTDPRTCKRLCNTEHGNLGCPDGATCVDVGAGNVGVCHVF